MVGVGNPDVLDYADPDSGCSVCGEQGANAQFLWDHNNKALSYSLAQDGCLPAMTDRVD